MAIKVLYVEDEPDIRLVMGDGLKYLGIDITTVKNADEAQKKLQFEQYDVILLDMMLPGISGWEFAEKLKGGIYKDLPIVALTAASIVGQEQKAYKIGCSAYIAKPCEPAEVKRKIEETLSRCRKL